MYGNQLNASELFSLQLAVTLLLLWSTNFIHQKTNGNYLNLPHIQAHKHFLMLKYKLGHKELCIGLVVVGTNIGIIYIIMLSVITGSISTHSMV